MNRIKGGIWPTMITPYTKDDKIDYEAMEKLIEWYIKNGASGIFTVCLSSEMFNLTPEERLAIAKFTVGKVRGRVQVAASGNVSKNRDVHIDEIAKMHDTGVDAVVLLTNNISEKDDDEQVKKRVSEILKKIPQDAVLGLYECPVPYKYGLSPEIVKWFADTERFGFFKETSCDITQIAAKQKAADGSNLTIHNANSALITKSYFEGVEGFCGVLANFFPDLLAWHYRNYRTRPEKAKRLQSLFGAVGSISSRLFPVCAKQFLGLEGVHMNIAARNVDMLKYIPAFYEEIIQFRDMIQEYRMDYSI